MLHSIDTARRLYVIKCDGGYTCHGFDNADRRARAVAEWACLAPPTAALGTSEHYAQCDAVMAAGAAHAARTGTRCPAELTPALTGLEGKRIEVTEPGQAPRRFWVGRSTGWLPVHLEIATRRSFGGSPVSLPAGSAVRVISAR